MGRSTVTSFSRWCSPRSVEEAVVAINALNGYIAGGNMLEVKFADSDAGPKNPKLPHGTTPCDNLYVRNLPTGWNEGDVISLFMPYGEIVESRLLTAGANERGVGALVRMAAVEQATNAIDGLNGQTAPGGLLPLMVRYADSAEDKARRHQRQLRGSRYSPYPSSTTAGNIPVSAAINAASPDGIPHLSSTSSLPAGFTAFNPTGLPDVPDMSGPQRMDSSMCYGW